METYSGSAYQLYFTQTTDFPKETMVALQWYKVKN